MKFRALSRSDDEFARPSTADTPRSFVNRDSGIHAMSRATEYTRALRATKNERIFAKPLVCAMSEHLTGAVTCLCRPMATSETMAFAGEGAVGVASVLSGTSNGELLLVCAMMTDYLE